ncbi:MAG: single-stranded DNA-binding protein [Lachnospiraceae bacterium]|nr:single-stranded DNA-binding protein [Lachnospiraceae bacterium]MDE6999687.1 single-stranded DNA-binding protein [Lachnospiraceae bacterium]
MFTQISTLSRVPADLDLQTSQNKTQYVQFNVAVNKGFGEQEHANFFQCVLFGKAALTLWNTPASRTTRKARLPK